MAAAPICKHPGGYQLPPRLPRVLCVGVVTASPPGRYPPRRRGAQKPEIQLFEHKARKSLPGRKKLSDFGLSRDNPKQARTAAVSNSNAQVEELEYRTWYRSAAIGRNPSNESASKALRVLVGSQVRKQVKRLMLVFVIEHRTERV